MVLAACMHVCVCYFVCLVFYACLFFLCFWCHWRMVAMLCYLVLILLLGVIPCVTWCYSSCYLVLFLVLLGVIPLVTTMVLGCSTKAIVTAQSPQVDRASSVIVAEEAGKVTASDNPFVC